MLPEPAAPGEFASTAELTDERATLISHAFIESGYNTNYAAGWHLVRSVPRFTFDDSTRPARILAVGNPGSQGLKGINTTQGGLRIKTLDQGPIAASRIGLLGDAAPGDIDEAIAGTVFAVGTEAPVTDPWAALTGNNRTFINAGELLSRSLQ